jgi:hypothetical protein
MRLALVSLAACGTTYGAVTVTPDNGPPVGVGLVATYQVAQDVCDGTYEADCTPLTPTPTVEIASGTAVELGTTDTGSFTVAGVAVGSAVLDVYGEDDAVTAFDLDAALVGSTRLFVKRHTDVIDYPDVGFPLSAFAGSRVVVDQISLGPDQSPRAGVADLALAAGETGVTYDPFDHWFDTGGSLGTAIVSTPLTTGAIHVVDGAAITTFTVGESQTTITEFVTHDKAVWYLLPVDTFGAPIVGAGPRPTITLADPSLVAIDGEVTDGGLRGVTVEATKVGTTTVDIVWGTAHETFTLNVIE